jgi:hypothetical protein
MSIGNLKDTGNQGNNLPFQWKVLQGLQQLLTQVSQPLDCAEDSIKICATDLAGNPAPVFQGNVKCTDALGVTLCTSQAQIEITPGLLASTTLVDPTGNLTGYSGNQILSISFASNGTAAAKVSVDGGTIYHDLAPGTTLNLDANGIMNYYDPAIFYWDTTTSGGSLLIAFNFI